MSVKNNVSINNDLFFKNIATKKSQQYKINPNGADNASDTDTVEISTKKSKIKKLAVGTAIVAGIAIIAASIGGFIHGKKPAKTKMTEDAKKIYDEIASKLNKKTEITAETIEKNLAPKQKEGAWNSKDMKEYYTQLEKKSTENAAKKLELERAEQAAVEREQAYIDRTYNTRKSAQESAIVFEEKFIQDQKQGIQTAIDNINISNANSSEVVGIRQQIESLTDPSLKNKYKQILDDKLANYEDNLTRQKVIKEKLEEYEKALTADKDSCKRTKSSTEVQSELEEFLGHKNNFWAFYRAKNLFDPSTMGYVDVKSTVYPFLASKTLTSIDPSEWKQMCQTIDFFKRRKNGGRIVTNEIPNVLRNLDSPTYNQKKIKDEIKNIYGLDLDAYRSNFLDWLDKEYYHSLTIKIPKEDKTKLIQNVLNNKKPISGTAVEIKSELEKAIPILKDNPKTQIIAEELERLENNSEFNKLDDLHKTIAKWNIITQDIRYNESTAIFREYKIPNVIQNRILYSNIQDPQILAASMMHSGDIEMFSIIDKVKRNIDTSYKGIDIEKLKSNIARINNVNNQNFIFSDRPVTSAIPIQTITNHGKNYKVKLVDLADQKVLSHLEDYGFLPGTNPKDLEFVVHMFKHDKEEIYLTQLHNAIKNKETVTLSTSLTNGTNRLHDHGNIGVVVDYDQNSVLNAFNRDLNSGTNKNFPSRQWYNKILDESHSGQEYSFVKSELKNILGVNDAEYLELTTYLKDKRYLTQIKDIQIGNKKLSGEEIRKALKESQKKLFTGPNGYNEIELFNPSIEAIYLKDIAISDVPSYIFEYAEKHNLPIIHQ